MRTQSLIVVLNFQNGLPFALGKYFNGIVARALRIAIERRIRVILADEMAGKNQLHFGYFLRFGPIQ